jgi:hypothetical protein
MEINPNIIRHRPNYQTRTSKTYFKNVQRLTGKHDHNEWINWESLQKKWKYSLFSKE